MGDGGGVGRASRPAHARELDGVCSGCLWVGTRGSGARDSCG